MGRFPYSQGSPGLGGLRLCLVQHWVRGGHSSCPQKAPGFRWTRDGPQTLRTCCSMASTGAWPVLRAGPSCPMGKHEKGPAPWLCPTPASTSFPGLGSASVSLADGELQEGSTTPQFPRARRLCSHPPIPARPQAQERHARKWRSHTLYSRTGWAPNHSRVSLSRGLAQGLLPGTAVGGRSADAHRVEDQHGDELGQAVQGHVLEDAEGRVEGTAAFPGEQGMGIRAPGLADGPALAHGPLLASPDDHGHTLNAGHARGEGRDHRGFGLGE